MIRIANDIASIVAVSPFFIALWSYLGGGLEKANKWFILHYWNDAVRQFFPVHFYMQIHFLEGHFDKDFTIVNLGKSPACPKSPSV